LQLPRSSYFPDAVFREGAGHQAFAIRAEGGPGSVLLRSADVKIVGHLPRLSVPDLDSPPLPIPGCQPPTIRAEGGKAHTVAPDNELLGRGLQIKEEDLAARWAVGDGSTIGT